MKTFACLCLTALFCTLLTQCAVQPVAPLLPPVAERFTETTTSFAGNTYVRRETEMTDGSGDSRIRVTQR
jgi:hypothetical protein